MNLCYRGATYRATATAVTATNSEVIGRYRGGTCRRSHFDLTMAQPRLNLKYRGVSYTTGVDIAEHTFELGAHKAEPTLAIFSHHIQSELEKVHNVSIRKSVERRLSVARSQGNQALVDLLEAEHNQLVS